MHFDVIAFDADDTLWHNERLYERTQAELAKLLAPYGVESRLLAEHLFATQTGNLEYFGYGIKSFTLSMIQAAVELTDGAIAGKDVAAIVELARLQLRAPVELLEHAAEAVRDLAENHHLMIITKGDLLDQESKVARSGLGKYFRDIEVVSDKTPASYTLLLQNHDLNPGRVLMVGDSLRSDILPVLELGCRAVYIPYQTVWLHEAAEAPAPGTPGYYRLKHLGELPGLVRELEKSNP